MSPVVASGGQTLLIDLSELLDTDAKMLAWAEFREHHYSPETFNGAARTFLAYEGDALVGMTAVLAMPSGTLRGAWRSHKVVVLPAYRDRWQVVADAQAQLIVGNGKRYFCNASDAPSDLVAYRDDPASGWKPTCKNGKVPQDNGHSSKKFGKKVRATNDKGVIVSHEYLGFDKRMSIGHT
jgi:hypothetical protein